jgi:Spy/CpxP family protein refolding chaperone
MRPIPLAALAAVFLASIAAAQTADAPAPAASASHPVRVGSEYTPGWDMMTAEERDAVRQRMIAAPTKAECRRLRDEQLETAARRANARGMKNVPSPRYDACD